jgi:hypothetical protein
MGHCARRQRGLCCQHGRRAGGEYARNGVANLFMMFAPLEGWRHVKVTDRHTAIDYAHALKDLSDTHFPPATTAPGVGPTRPAVAYTYAPGRGAVHALKLLDHYRGIVQCDGYAAYKTIANAASDEHCSRGTARAPRTGPALLRSSKPAN